MVDQYKYQHSHLLQFIYEAHKEGSIDHSEKLKIKGTNFNNTRNGDKQ
jgi:hypothetical protein